MMHIKHVQLLVFLVFVCCRDGLDSGVCTLRDMLMPYLNTGMLLQASSLRILPSV
jgi:hypothetical protein